MKFFIWAQERFPVLNVTTAFVMSLAAKLSVANGSVLTWSGRDVFGGFLVLSHLFLLRVLDEHKDFESDKTYHPERVLQKGVLSLSDIRRYGWIAFGIEIVSFAAFKPSSFSVFMFLLLWLWTFLMFKEFGARDFLRPRLFLYSFSHLLVSPLLFLSMASLYSSDPQEINSQVAILLVLSLATGFLYELTRKNKSVDEDQKGEISFSLLYGRKTTSGFIVLSAVVSLVTGGYFLEKSSMSLAFYSCGAVLLFGLLLAVLREFLRNPLVQARKKNEGVAGLVSIWSLLYPIIGFLVQAEHVLRGWP